MVTILLYSCFYSCFFFAPSVLILTNFLTIKKKEGECFLCFCFVLWTLFYELQFFFNNPVFLVMQLCTLFCALGLHMPIVKPDYFVLLMSRHLCLFPDYCVVSQVLKIGFFRDEVDFGFSLRVCLIRNLKMKGMQV